jgi:hypothetical protein
MLPIIKSKEELRRHNKRVADLIKHVEPGQVVVDLEQGGISGSYAYTHNEEGEEVNTDDLYYFGKDGEYDEYADEDEL